MSDLIIYNKSLWMICLRIVYFYIMHTVTYLDSILKGWILNAACIYQMALLLSHNAGMFCILLVQFSNINCSYIFQNEIVQNHRY